MAVLPTGIGPVTGYNVERSLRFNSADTAYLNRTPAGAGNLQTWTWSGWVKRSALGASQTIFALFDYLASPLTNKQHGLRFLSGDTIEYWCYQDPAYNGQKITTQVFRDVSAWYHIVAVWDTPNATAANRMRLYVNGSEVTTFGTNTNPTQNSNGEINRAFLHTIGTFYDPDFGSPTNSLNGYLTEVNFIGGQALTPSSFGETDSATGVWKPKKYDGTYGTNGFYLPFKTASQWSGYFDGNTDYLSVPHNSSLSPTGDFTIEFWAYTGSTALQEWVTKGYGIQIYSNASNWYAALSSSNNTTYFINGSFGAHSTNTWQHIAISRQGNTYRGFVNGVATTLGTSSSAPSTGTDSLLVGTVGPGTIRYYVTGYLSNLRIVDGTAVYTGDFTPPTSQLTAITNTSLLTCQSSTFVDNSTNAFTVTATGDTRPQQFSPFTLDVTDDHSGQGNHWIPNNLDLRTTDVGADILVDSPTSYGTDTGVGGEVRGNYCVLNTLSRSISTNAPTPTNGNLEYATPAGVNTTGWPFVLGSIGISSGKWYFEVDITGLEADSVAAFGFVQTTIVNDSDNTDQLDKIIGAIIRNDSVSTGLRSAVLGTYVTRDGADATDAVYQIAIDNDLGKLWIGKANTWYASGNPSAGTNEIGTFTSQSLIPLAMLQKSNTTGDSNLRYNFGQRAFAYTAPSGFKTLCTQNLPTPTIGATSTTQANDYMNVVTWSGNASSPRAITGVGFQPDLLWIKSRSNAYDNLLMDAIRGTGNLKWISSNLTDAEGTNFNNANVTSLDSDGFTIGTTGGTNILNANTVTNVAWNWKANGAGSTNSNGTAKSSSVTVDSGTDTVTWNSHGMSNGQKIGFFATTMPGGLSAGTLYYVRDAATNTFKVAASSGGAAIDITSNGTTVTAHTTLTSTVSANTTSGFSVVTYTGTGANATVEHGLGVAPRMIIIKGRNTSVSWPVWHTSFGTAGNSDYLLLNTTDQKGYAGGSPNAQNLWNSTTPTSNVFSLGTYAYTNANTTTYVAYCFAPVAGYSAFGSYTGNGAADGPFVYTGFRPRFVMRKRTDSATDGAWAMHDASRNPTNVIGAYLFANLSDAEGSADLIDFTSNGFKLRTSSGGNVSTGTYIYAAFAEHPFKYSLAR